MFMVDRNHIALTGQDEPVLLAWPRPGNAEGLVRFDKATDWRDLDDGLSIVCAKFARAKTLYVLAQADPFKGVPQGGLLELVRDLIHLAYRKYIAEAARIDALPASSG